MPQAEAVGQSTGFYEHSTKLPRSSARTRLASESVSSAICVVIQRLHLHNQCGRGRLAFSGKESFSSLLVYLLRHSNAYRLSYCTGARKQPCTATDAGGSDQPWILTGGRKLGHHDGRAD